MASGLEGIFLWLEARVLACSAPARNSILHDVHEVCLLQPLSAGM